MAYTFRLSIIGLALIIALAGCGSILPSGGAPTAAAPTTVVEAPTESAPAEIAPTDKPTEVPAAATSEAAAPTEAPAETATSAPSTPTTPPAPSPTTAPTAAPEPSATPQPTDVPLYLAPTAIPGVPTAAPPTNTPSATATPSATSTTTASPTLNPSAEPTPTATYPPIPVVSSLRGIVANPGNVRADPNVRAAAVDRVNPGEEVQLLGRSDNSRWYLVLTVRGVAGWVSATLLTVDPETAAQVPLNPDILLPTPPGGAPTATATPTP